MSDPGNGGCFRCEDGSNPEVVCKACSCYVCGNYYYGDPSVLCDKHPLLSQPIEDAAEQTARSIYDMIIRGLDVHLDEDWCDQIQAGLREFARAVLAEKVTKA